MSHPVFENEVPIKLDAGKLYEWEEFTELMKNSPLIPYTSYDLIIWTCSYECDMHEEDPKHRHVYSFKVPEIANFFTVCGPNMRKLKIFLAFDPLKAPDALIALAAQLGELPELENLWLDIHIDKFHASEYQDRGVLRDYVNVEAGQGGDGSATECFRKLKKLNLMWNGKEYGVPAPPIMASPILTLLSASPNLELLDLNHCDDNDFVTFLLGSQFMESAVCQRALRKFEGLRVHGQSGLTNLENLLELEELKFNSLEISIGKLEKHAAGLLEAFLWRQSQHLKNFKITLLGRNVAEIEDGNADEIRPLDKTLLIPVMSAVETLEIERGYHVVDTFTALKFISNQFPALKQLIYDKHWENCLPPTPVPSVTNLTVCSVSSEEQLNILASTFPNVTVLELGIDFSVLPSLWAKWPQLTSLRFCPRFPADGPAEGPSMDSVLTGIPDSALAEENPSDDLSHLKTAPGLRDQLHLQQLVLSGLNNCPLIMPGQQGDRVARRFCITDITGYQAFVPFGPQLRKLWIGNPNIGRRNGFMRLMSAECKKAIKRALGLDAEIVFK